MGQQTILNSTTDNSPHAVTMFGFDQNKFKIKNSYFAQKQISIDRQLPYYAEFLHLAQMKPPRYQARVHHIDPNFTDQSYILFHIGYCLRFKDKRKFAYSALCLNVTRLKVTIFEKFSKIDC